MEVQRFKNSMKGKRVVVGLSGGVDSSVAAALLIEQGYEVHGVYLECYNEPGCRTDQDKKDALQVAMHLGIRFQTLDFRNAYRERVIEYFYSEYEAGRTPNPDVMCNREIKFGIFYDWALRQAQGKLAYDYVATGHYSRIAKTKDGSLLLQRARDEHKDQSYFLWQIPRDHLSHVLFPLGEMLKSEVREKARELGLPTASKPDSMGICFIGEVDVSKLLRDRLGEKPGEVVMKITNNQVPITKQSINNKQIATQIDDWNLDIDYLEDYYAVVGRHRGLWFYTIGERKGLEIDKQVLKKFGLHPEKMGPLYVIGKNVDKNQLIVGSRASAAVKTFRIDDDSKVLQAKKKLWVRIRNLGELHEVKKLDGNTVEVYEPLFGIAQGQSAAFYDERGILVGGGIIV